VENDIFNSANTNTNKKSKLEAIRLNNDGLKFSILGNQEKAMEMFNKSIENNDKLADPYCNIANIYLQKGENKKALELYQKAIELDDTNPNYYFNLGVTYSIINKIDQAIKYYDLCLKYDPEYSNALKYLGNCLKDQKKFASALKIYRKWQMIEPSNPIPIFNQGVIHIRNGRLDIGWKMYEAGLKNNIRQPLKGFYEEKKELWDGIPFDGTLLIYGEQGLGDQLAFGTILNELLKDQKKVILKLDKRLKNLFEDSFPGLTVVPEEELISQDYQKYILIGSLCKFYRNHTNDFMKSPFNRFNLNSNLPKKLKVQIDNLKNLKIGFSWHTFANKGGRERCLSVSEVSRILSCNNNSFINLQYGNVLNLFEEINKKSKNKLNSIDGLDLTQDLNGVINVIKRCDLIITIDNSLAHLAGSLGKQVWILLPYSADFRWMEDVSASLWYQNAILLRQNKHNSWENVIKIIEHAFSEKSSGLNSNE